LQLSLGVSDGISSEKEKKRRRRRKAAFVVHSFPFSHTREEKITRERGIIMESCCTFTACSTRGGGEE